MAHSYDDVGMRDVARDVGVDAALVSRYFGGKEDLFLEVLDSCKNKRSLIEGERSSFGERVAREIIAGPCEEDTDGNGFSGLLILLRSIGWTKAMDVVQRTANNRFFDPLTQWIGGEDAAVRARLASGLIMGMAIGRELSDGFSALTDEQRDRLRDRMAKALQGLIDG